MSDVRAYRRHLACCPMTICFMNVRFFRRFSVSATHTAHRLRVSLQAFPLLSCGLLQLFEHSIPWCIFPIPPAPSILDQHVIDVGAIWQEYIGKGAPLLVLAVAGLDCSVLRDAANGDPP